MDDLASRPQPTRRKFGLVSWVFACVLVVSACAHPQGAPVATAAVSLAPAPAPGTDRIDLELHDVDIYDGLRELSRRARVSLFLDPDLTGQVTFSAHGIAWSDALARMASDHALRIERLTVHGSQRPSFWVSRLSTPPAPQLEFVGGPIAINFEETPIAAAAKTLADAAKTTIVVEEGVDVAVTLHLRNLPWDLALAHLAQKYNLQLVRTDGAIHVSRTTGAPR